VSKRPIRSDRHIHAFLTPNQEVSDMPMVSGVARKDAPGTFATLLIGYRERVGLSQGMLARYSGVDQSYVTKIERGDRLMPGRAVTLALAETLELSARQTDRLLYAAGLAPQRDYQALYEDVERRLAAVVAAATGSTE
jgi:transcriptional regulator with XRE-family HTH domain